MQQDNMTARTRYEFLDFNSRFKKMSQQDITTVLQSFMFQISNVTAEGSKSKN